MSHTSSRKRSEDLELRIQNSTTLEEPLATILSRKANLSMMVSKLLGYSSVTTTERHYAPLLTTEIDDFIL